MNTAPVLGTVPGSRWWPSVVDALEWRSSPDGVIDGGRAAFDTVARLGLARLRRFGSAVGDVLRAIPPTGDEELVHSSLAPLLIFSQLLPEEASAGLFRRWPSGVGPGATDPVFSGRPEPLVELLRGEIGVDVDWLDPARAESATAKAESAFALIESTSPHCAHLIRRCTRLIILMGSSEPEIGSLSHCWCAGLSLILNAHEGDVSVAAVADRIIHESIHDLLYTGHFTEPVLADPRANGPAADVVIESPWTGRPLSLRNYLHACFVWYGLARFWSLDAQAFSADHCRQRRLVAEGGFCKVTSILEPLAAGVDLLSPGVRAALELLDRRARQ